MENRNPRSRNYLRIIVDFLILLLGLLVVIGSINFAPENFTLAWVMALSGAFISSGASAVAQRVGLIVSGVGVYLLLRQYGIIDRAVLEVGIGIYFILIGAINFIRDVKGRNVPIQDQQAEETNQ